MWKASQNVCEVSWERQSDEMTIELINDCGETYEIYVDNSYYDEASTFEEAMQIARKFMKDNP